MKVQSALEYLLANQDWLLGLEALTRLSKFFSGLFSVAFSGFCCSVLLITRLKVVYRNMGSKHKHDRKRGLRKVSEGRWSSHQLSRSSNMFEDGFRSKIQWEMKPLVQKKVGG